MPAPAVACACVLWSCGTAGPHMIAYSAPRHTRGPAAHGKAAAVFPRFHLRQGRFYLGESARYLVVFCWLPTTLTQERDASINELLRVRIGDNDRPGRSHR
jgi:hypothetical protein